MSTTKRPLDRKNYGSIPHLPQSRKGSDKRISEGQARIATEKARDSNDEIIVQEKLDGSNVGIARKDGQIIPLSRAGYRAETSPYEQHHEFANWVLQPNNWKRFTELLNEGERLVGEWLMQAHGTRYNLQHEPFVAFDLMAGSKRFIYDKLVDRTKPFDVVLPYLIHKGSPISVEKALGKLGRKGFHGADDFAEGAIWRVERDGEVDFLAKYVRPEKKDGVYLDKSIFNWRPNDS